MVRDVGPAPRVEDVDRVGQAIAGEREHGLVHHHDRRLAVRHRPAVGIAEHEVEHRLAAGRQGLLAGRHGEVERARRGRDRQVEAAARERRPRRAPSPGSRRRLLAGRLAHQVDLDVHVGREALLDGDLERVRAARDREALLAQEAAAAQGQDPLRGGEGRQHQDLRHVARPVLLPVGDERDLLFLEAAAGGHAAAGHPDPQLGLVLAAPLVRHAGHDAPGSALLRLEARAHGLARGLERPLLRVLRDLLPLALDLLPVEPLGAQEHRRAPRPRGPRGRWRSRRSRWARPSARRPAPCAGPRSAPTGGRGGPPRRSTPAGSRP